MKRGVIRLGLVMAASLAIVPASFAAKEKKPVLPTLPVVVMEPYDDDGTSDSRKDVGEVLRPLPPSGPATPIPYCGPSSPECP